MNIYALVLFCSSAVSLAVSTHFDMKDLGARNSIYFVSSGPLERTVGISNAIGGWLEVDRDRVQDSIKGMFEVDVRAFYTGIEARNEFFRDKVANASEFPIATFTIGRAKTSSAPKLVESVTIALQVEGTLRMRGGDLPQTILMKLSYFKANENTRQRLPGNLVRLESNFDVDMKVLGVQIPDAYRLRYSPFVQVSVDVLGTDQLPGTLPLPPQDPPPTKPGKKKSN
jgi:YceI-like domain